MAEEGALVGFEPQRAIDWRPWQVAQLCQELVPQRRRPTSSSSRPALVEAPPDVAPARVTVAVLPAFGVDAWIKPRTAHMPMIGGLEQGGDHLSVIPTWLGFEGGVADGVRRGGGVLLAQQEVGPHSQHQQATHAATNGTACMEVGGPEVDACGYQ